jgi:hypothetical protein
MKKIRKHYPISLKRFALQKAIIITVVFASLCCASCKKSAPPPFQSYLKFNLDAVQTECNAHIKATFMSPSLGPDNILTISGDWAGGSIELDLNDGQVLIPGTYTFQSRKWRTADIWINEPTGRYYSAGWGGLLKSRLYGSGQITISEISPEYVKGTFEFVTGVDIHTTDLKTVTNGEFHIKRGY